MPAGGTTEWADWHMVHSFTEEFDRAVITSLWGYMMGPEHRDLQGQPYRVVSLSRVHTRYALACHEMQWPGWKATLVWGMLTAWAKPHEDDIPF
jgi:hypothetical protein